MAKDEGYIVIPLPGGTPPIYAVIAPDGSLVSEHPTMVDALREADRLNQRSAK
jgi:hypothetical protein